MIFNTAPRENNNYSQSLKLFMCNVCKIAISQSDWTGTTNCTAPSQFQPNGRRKGTVNIFLTYKCVCKIKDNFFEINYAIFIPSGELRWKDSVRMNKSSSIFCASDPTPSARKFRKHSNSNIIGLRINLLCILLIFLSNDISLFLMCVLNVVN